MTASARTRRAECQAVRALLGLAEQLLDEETCRQEWLTKIAGTAVIDAYHQLNNEEGDGEQTEDPVR